jgi:uncharacterized protein YndB with AHSA1/START domain
MLGTLHTRADGRFELRFERRFAHPVARVWRALTDPEHLRAWFPALVDMGLTPGGKLRFELMPEAQARHGLSDEDMTSYGELTAVDPPGLLEYTWSGEILRWELEPTAHGWHVALEALSTALDGRDVDRLALFDRADEMSKTYACCFGR